MARYSRSRVSAYSALALGVTIIGFAAILIRQADAPGAVTALYRMGIGALVMTGPFGYALSTGKCRLTRYGVGMAILGGAGFGLDLALWATGVTMSGASNPTLLANTAPIWVGLGAWLIFHERQAGQFWLGMSVALSGAIIVLGQDLSQAANLGLGSLLGLLAGVFYGVSTLAAQQGRRTLNTLAYFYISTLSSAVVLLIVNLLLRNPLTGYPARTYLIFLGLGAGVQIFGWLAVNYAQGYLPASLVSPTLLAQPVVTALLAGALIGERFTRWQIMGGITVLIGIYMVHHSRMRPLPKISRRDNSS